MVILSYVYYLLKELKEANRKAHLSEEKALLAQERANFFEDDAEFLKRRITFLNAKLGETRQSSTTSCRTSKDMAAKSK